MTKPSHPLKGALLALASFCAYACSDVSIKALGHGMNSFQVMFFSALCTVPFILAQMFWQDRRPSLRPNLPGLTVIRVLISLLGGWFVIYTFTHLPLAQCYAIFFTMPLMITLLAWPLLGEPVDPLRGAIILAGFGGVLIALQPGTTQFQLAHLTAILGAMTGALNSLILRKIGHREKSGVILLYPVLAQVLVAGLIMPFVWTPLTLSDWQVGLQMGALGLVGGVVYHRRLPHRPRNCRGTHAIQPDRLGKYSGVFAVGRKTQFGVDLGDWRDCGGGSGPVGGGWPLTSARPARLTPHFA